jgi:predicted O-methyltransferase YrrM
MTDQFDSGFLEIVSKLNKVIAESNEPVEGNLFYAHHDEAFPNGPIVDYFALKRANLMAACRGKGRVLEIGVNAGHSALMMLYHNPGLHYVGVDICSHAYTWKAMDFLNQQFPGRVTFFVGDSVFVLPEIRVTRPDLLFDLMHIDGLHTLAHCKTDTYNAITMALPYGWIIIDDTDMKHLKEFYNELVAKKILLPKQPEGWQYTGHHDVGLLPQ